MSKKQSGEYVRIETLTPDPHNANTHDARSIEAIARSLKQFGQVKPIVVDAAGVILAGNGTREAALSLGWESIWIVQTELTGDEARAFAIADNRTQELSEWNFEQLNRQLGELQASAKDLFDAAWFDPIDAMQRAERIEDGNSVAEHYQGMPEYISEDKKPWKQLVVSFANEDDLKAFAEMCELPVTATTKSVWFPRVESDRFSDIGYAADGS